MTAEPVDRVALFERDIAASAESLTALLDGWSPIDRAGRPRIVFSGLGSSRFAALAVASQLRTHGSSAWVEYASSSMPMAPAEDLTAVAISASGRTPEVHEAARRHRGRSLVVAVTNDPDSPLAPMADVVVPLRADRETAGIACRSYRATLAALALLTGLASSPDDLRPAVSGLARRLGEVDPWLSEAVDVLDGASSIDVLADAPLLGLAEQAALMLREAPRLPATAYDSGDWLHTGVYLALPGHRVLLFPGAAADHEVIDTVRRRGGEVLSVPMAAVDGSETIRRAIVNSIVAELLAVRLWDRARAR